MMEEKVHVKVVETSKDKRIKKIAQLKAKLQKEEALLNKNKRQERNGQLIALGILVEEMYKKSDESSRQKWAENAKNNLADRNLERVLKAFERLEKEVSG